MPNEERFAVEPLLRGRRSKRDEFERHPLDSFLYAIGCDGCIKVGVSDHPPSRRSSLQSATPHRLHLLQTWRISRAKRETLERYVHELLRDRHVRLEWFEVSIDVVEAAVEYARRVTAADLEALRLVPRPLTFLHGEMSGLGPRRFPASKWKPGISQSGLAELHKTTTISAGEAA